MQQGHNTYLNFFPGILLITLLPSKMFHKIQKNSIKCVLYTFRSDRQLVSNE